MCVIILKPYEQTVETEVLNKAAQINKDGIGIYSYNPISDKVAVVKNLTYKEKTAQKFNEKHLFTVFHFRLTSAGNNKSKNIHPHKIKDNWWLFHNGTILNLSGHEYLSDTNLLARTIAKFDAMQLNVIGKLIEAFDDDKFVMVNKDKYYIVNEEEGEWHEGTWMSNTFPLDKKKKVFVYGTCKQGFSDSYMLRDAKYLGEAMTTNPYPMQMDSGWPVMMDMVDLEKGLKVYGEVWEVDEKTFNTLKDIPLDIHYYREKSIYVNMLLEPKISRWVDVFVVDRAYFNPESLVYNTFFKAYDSSSVASYDKPLTQFTH